MRQTDIPIGKTSTLLAEQRFYEDTFLHDDEGAILFVCDAALVRGPSGRERLRTKHDTIHFDSPDDLVSTVADSDWTTAPLDKNPRWKPTRDMVAT